MSRSHADGIPIISPPVAMCIKRRNGFQSFRGGDGPLWHRHIHVQNINHDSKKLHETERAHSGNVINFSFLSRCRPRRRYCCCQFTGVGRSAQPAGTRSACGPIFPSFFPSLSLSLFVSSFFIFFPFFFLVNCGIC